MTTRVVVATALAITVLAAPRPAAAQYRVHYGYYRPTPPLVPTITPYVGYMYMDQYVHGPLGTSASGADAGLVGAQLTLPLSPNFALVGNLGHANSSLVFFEPAGGGPTVGNTEVWLFDGGIQLSAPFPASYRHWVSPFVQLGAGAMRYGTQNLAGTAHATNFALNFGAGLDYTLARTVGVRFLFKDYVGHWNDPTRLPFNSGDRFTHNPSISAGLNIGL